ncbi:MAG: hypothetical protein ACMZ64_07850 [Oleiphilus sp.]
MSSSDKSLVQVLHLLKEAVEKEDWQEAEVLDKKIKSGLQQAVTEAGDEHEKKALIALLHNVQSLYQLLITSTEASRSKVSSELKKISNDKKAVNFYLKSSQYR